MIKRIRYAIVLLAIAFLFLSGCSHSTKTSMAEQNTSIELSKKEQEDNMEKEMNMFIQSLGIDKDCAKGAVQCARDSGVAEIANVKKLKSKAGYVALVTDKNKMNYTFGFGSMGYLEYILSEKNGEYIYAAYE